MPFGSEPPYPAPDFTNTQANVPPLGQSGRNDWRLRWITPSLKRRAESTAKTSQGDKCRQPEDHGSHHDEGEPFGRFCKIQERLNLRSGVAGGRLLDLLHHFASQLCTPVKHGDSQRLENGRHAEKQEAADGPEPGPSCGPDHNPWTAVTRECNRQQPS